ncbi:MAG: hypothetical protein R3C53_18865 [Pirellulaceae bacterium]
MRENPAEQTLQELQSHAALEMPRTESVYSSAAHVFLSLRGGAVRETWDKVVLGMTDWLACIRIHH